MILSHKRVKRVETFGGLLWVAHFRDTRVLTTAPMIQAGQMTFQAVDGLDLQ